MAAEENLSGDQFISGPWTSGGRLYGPAEPADFQRERLASRPGAGYRIKPTGAKKRDTPRNRDTLTYNGQEGRYE